MQSLIKETVFCIQIASSDPNPYRDRDPVLDMGFSLNSTEIIVKSYFFKKRTIKGSAGEFQEGV